MNRVEVIERLQANVEKAEAAYNRSLRRVLEAVEDGVITAEEADCRPSLLRLERTIARRRGELEQFLTMQAKKGTR